MDAALYLSFLVVFCIGSGRDVRTQPFPTDTDVCTVKSQPA